MSHKFMIYMKFKIQIKVTKQWTELQINNNKPRINDITYKQLFVFIFYKQKKLID